MRVCFFPVLTFVVDVDIGVDVVVDVNVVVDVEDQTLRNSNSYYTQSVSLCVQVLFHILRNSRGTGGSKTSP